VDFLLGRVERVESIEGVSGRRTALTTDGMLYSGFAASRMNEADWQMRYIGQDSIVQQIEEISRLLAQEAAQIDHLNLTLKPLQMWSEEKTLSDEFMENVTHAVAGTRELPELERAQDALWRQIQTLDDSFVKQLKSEQKQVDAELSSLREKERDLNRSIGDLERQHNNLYTLGSEKEQAWEEARAIFLGSYPEEDHAYEQMTVRYEQALQQKGSAEKVQSDFEPALAQTTNRLTALADSFKQRAEMFNLKHPAASVNTDMASGAWRKAYDEAKLVRLDAFTDQAAKARSRAEELFYNEFINKVKGNIDTAKREINLLNKALEEYRFGRTQYRFKCMPTENAEMRMYHDMIVNLRLDGVNIFDLLESGKDFSEYEPLVKTLFGLISSDGADPADRRSVEANIEHFKSFQTYLKFDLVEVGPDGSEYPLSRTMGSKSGGERQTPFYVAILASLMKTYRVSQNANSLRLVVFDEAFDKIDTSRIEECVTMLREIGFQSLIVAPDNKAPYIAPFVERTMVVRKPDDKTSVVLQHQKDLEVCR